MTPLKKSPYSRHFNVLLLMGAWYYETSSNFKVTLFVFYKLLMSFVGVYGVASMGVDFYLVIGDIKKMSWNLCVSVLFICILAKTFQLVPHNKAINQLRLKLHQDAESRSTAEDILIQNAALRELRMLQMSFYVSSSTVIPAWILTRYFNYKGELPLPLRLAFYVDLNDDVEFAAIFAVLAWAGVMGLILGVETELAMFGLMIQISREYRVLMKDILKLNELYEIRNHAGREVNPILKKLKTKLLVKRLSARQGEIINYTKVFENCYSQTFLYEFFAISFLIVVIGLQLMLESFDLSGSMIYQMGYVAILTVDLYLICWFSTTLHYQCHEIGQVAYSTLWYRMSTDCQKDLAMIIMRSQHPPKITTGKLMVLDLNAFMNRMSNIISWLTLFQGLLTHQENTKN